MFAIGWFVAKLVRTLVEKFLQAAGADKLADKLKLSSFIEGTSISKIAGIIVFVLIIIPVSITALEILDLQGISQPAIAMLNNILAMLPKIFVAIVLVLVGIVLAKWIKDVVVTLLQNLGINSIFGKMGFSSTGGSTPSFAGIIGTIVQVVIILLFVVEALQVLDLEFMVTLATAIFAYLPHVIAAVVILAVGFWLANLAEKLVGSVMKHSSGTPHFLRYVAKYAILAFAFFMALSQLGIAAAIINSAFILILGGVALAFGLAFGLGGREHASRYLSKMEKSIEKADVSKERYETEKEGIKESLKENFRDPSEAEKSLKRGKGPHIDEVKPVGDFDQQTGEGYPTGNPMKQAHEEDSPSTGYNIPSTDDLHPYEDLPPNDNNKPNN